MINFCPITNFLGYGEKQSAAAFWNGELEEELRELGRLEFFGLMKKDEIDKYIERSLYIDICRRIVQMLVRQEVR